MQPMRRRGAGKEDAKRNGLWQQNMEVESSKRGMYNRFNEGMDSRGGVRRMDSRGGGQGSKIVHQSFYKNLGDDCDDDDLE